MFLPSKCLYNLSISGFWRLPKLYFGLTNFDKDIILLSFNININVKKNEFYFY